MPQLTPNNFSEVVICASENLCGGPQFSILQGDVRHFFVTAASSSLPDFGGRSQGSFFSPFVLSVRRGRRVSYFVRHPNELYLNACLCRRAPPGYNNVNDFAGDSPNEPKVHPRWRRRFVRCVLAQSNLHFILHLCILLSSNFSVVYHTCSFETHKKKTT